MRGLVVGRQRRRQGRRAAVVRAERIEGELARMLTVGHLGAFADGARFGTHRPNRERQPADRRVADRHACTPVPEALIGGIAVQDPACGRHDYVAVRDGSHAWRLRPASGAELQRVPALRNRQCGERAVAAPRPASA
jgi:hypothetical protein